MRPPRDPRIGQTAVDRKLDVASPEPDVGEQPVVHRGELRQRPAALRTPDHRRQEVSLRQTGKPAQRAPDAAPGGDRRGHGSRREPTSCRNIDGRIEPSPVREGDADGFGLGWSVGRWLQRRGAPHLGVSVLAAAHRLGLPATVHVAIGTDIVHLHPACDPDAVGRATHLDFRIFAAQVAKLGGGGVYVNVGSAVLLPEVFLKAVTLARNLGHPLRDFATANLDFIQSYRPNTNVVERPTRGVGRGYRLTGHHELMLPLLRAALVTSRGARRS